MNLTTMKEMQHMQYFKYIVRLLRCDFFCLTQYLIKIMFPYRCHIAANFFNYHIEFTGIIFYSIYIYSVGRHSMSCVVDFVSLEAFH